MEAVDGVFDNAKHVVDNAIDRIKKEIQLQKEKSDNLCKIKTAHNWQVGTGTWSPHTLWIGAMKQYFNAYSRYPFEASKCINSFFQK